MMTCSRRRVLTAPHCGFRSYRGTLARSPDPLVLVVRVPSGIPLAAIEQVVHLVLGEFRLVHGPS